MERALVILQWFLDAPHLLEMVHDRLASPEADEFHDFTLCLALAIGVAYYVRLEDRSAYEKLITHEIGIREGHLTKIVQACQDVFIDEVKLDKTVAKNDALKENFWVMILCVGKF